MAEKNTMNDARDIVTPAGRLWEVLLGLVCSAIGVMFSGLFVWFVYLVAWRNPREYGVHDLLKISTIAILGAMLIIGVFFLRLAHRLLLRPPGVTGLLAPWVLSAWGAFFATASLVIFVTIIVTDPSWRAYQAWTNFTLNLTMARALFRLARKREAERMKKEPSQQARRESYKMGRADAPHLEPHACRSTMKI